MCRAGYGYSTEPTDSSEKSDYSLNPMESTRDWRIPCIAARLSFSLAPAAWRERGLRLRASEETAAARTGPAGAASARTPPHLRPRSAVTAPRTRRSYLRPHRNLYVDSNRFSPVRRDATRSTQIGCSQRGRVQRIALASLHVAAKRGARDRPRIVPSAVGEIYTAHA